MNNIVIQGAIAGKPQLRYTQDNQTPISEVPFEFDGTNPNSPSTEIVKVVAWGEERATSFTDLPEGAEVIITGSLRVDSIDHPEGYKAKMISINVSSWELIGRSGEVGESSRANDVVAPPRVSPTTPVATAADYDDIPF